MKNTVPSFCVFVLLMLFLGGCTSGNAEPFTGDLPLVCEISSVEERLLNAVSANEQLDMETIGEVTYDTFEESIWMITFTPPGEPGHRVFFSGGVHGNEPAGAEALVQFVEDLSANPDKYNNFNFDIIPVVNPWGLERDIRYNRDGRDINRDFASNKTQEAVIVKDFLKDKKYDLMIDFHESPSADGFYLYQSALPDNKVSRKVIEAVRDLGYHIEQDISFIILKTDDGLIESPLWGIRLMSWTKQQSAAGYYRLHHTWVAYTVETPIYPELEERVMLQRLTLDMIIDSIE